MHASNQRAARVAPTTTKAGSIPRVCVCWCVPPCRRLDSDQPPNEKKKAPPARHHFLHRRDTPGNVCPHAAAAAAVVCLCVAASSSSSIGKGRKTAGLLLALALWALRAAAPSFSAPAQKSRAVSVSVDLAPRLQGRSSERRGDTRSIAIGAARYAFACVCGKVTNKRLVVVVRAGRSRAESESRYFRRPKQEAHNILRSKRVRFIQQSNTFKTKRNRPSFNLPLLILPPPFSLPPRCCPMRRRVHGTTNQSIYTCGPRFSPPPPTGTRGLPRLSTLDHPPLSCLSPPLS
jgi:hypothetical protein